MEGVLLVCVDLGFWGFVGLRMYVLGFGIGVWCVFLES